MQFPHAAQGKKRKLPDGFLHLNNYSHTRSSGIAGSLYERVFNEKQQEIVESALLDLCRGDESLVHFKHGVYRFDKWFLQENFQSVVYGTCDLIRRTPQHMISHAAVVDALKVKSQKVRYPSFD